MLCVCICRAFGRSTAESLPWLGRWRGLCSPGEGFWRGRTAQSCHPAQTPWGWHEHSSLSISWVPQPKQCVHPDPTACRSSELDGLQETKNCSIILNFAEIRGVCMHFYVKCNPFWLASQKTKQHVKATPQLDLVNGGRQPPKATHPWGRVKFHPWTCHPTSADHQIGWWQEFPGARGSCTLG